MLRTCTYARRLTNQILPAARGSWLRYAGSNSIQGKLMRSVHTSTNSDFTLHWTPKESEKKEQPKPTIPGTPPNAENLYTHFLHDAAESNDTDQIRKLIAEGASISAATDHGCTALWLASAKGCTEAVDVLAELGADVEAVNASGTSALLVAALTGHVEVVKVLVKRGANVNSRRKEDLATPLLAAVIGNHPFVIRELVNLGADLSAKLRGGTTVLHVAAEHGNTELVKGLVKLGASMDACLDKGGTPLALAVQNGFTECAKILLDLGSDPNKIISNGATSLHVAVQRGHKEIVELLAKYGSDFNIKTGSGSTPLHLTDSNEMATLLVKLGADVNASGSVGMRPIHFSAQAGELEMVTTLIDELKADIHVKTDEGYTALHLASMNGHLDTVSFLLKRGADVNAEGQFKTTPLHLACQFGHREVALLLMKERANVNAEVSTDGATPLYLATLKGFDDLAKLINQNGSDASIPMNTPIALLCAAAENGSTTLIEDVLNNNNGCDVDGRKKDGMTPLMLACKAGHKEAVKKLLTKGARINGDAPVSSSFELSLSTLSPPDFILKGKEMGLAGAVSAKLSPLHIAASLGRLDVVKLLIENGADLMSRDIEGAIPLHRAAYGGHETTAQALLAKLPSTATTTTQHSLETPLHAAASSNLQTLARDLVVNHGVDVNAKSKKGETPLGIARRKSQARVAGEIAKLGGVV